MPHPQYAEFKARIYEVIDPRFREYFDNQPRAAIRLDEIRWGGVHRDGIPPLQYPTLIDAGEATWLADGDVLTLGETTWEVRHCPGHTPGHVIFFNREARFAQVGDVLFQGSIGRTDFPRSDHASLLNAIVTKLWPLGDDVAFVPGHGPTSTFGEERDSNPFVGAYG